MRRREFLKSTGLAAAAAAALAPAVSRAADAASGDASAQQRVFELRMYHFASPEKLRAFETFVADVAIPAWNRAGARPVGAFRLLAKDNPEMKLLEDPNELWVFLPHPSAAAFVDFEPRLARDEQFRSAGQSILTGPRSDAAFARYESMLLRPMTGSPDVVPPKGRDRESLFELRTYESPTVERHLNKLAMFNAGEFGAFDRAGMLGVFFGGAVAASNLPQLTYMVCHRRAEDVKQHWSDFGSDATWTTLKRDPRYKDNVSRIIRRFLRAAKGSQI
jgi:hypothetical protein